jgi:uncharacterized protein (DUF433 family)
MKESNKNDEVISYKERLISGSNKWVDGNILIKGTTVPVTSIINDLKEGKSLSEIIEVRPEISQSDIKLCLTFAADLIHSINLDKAISLINDERKVLIGFADKIHEIRMKYNKENTKDSDSSKV